MLSFNNLVGGFAQVPVPGRDFDLHADSPMREVSTSKGWATRTILGNCSVRWPLTQLPNKSLNESEIPGQSVDYQVRINGCPTPRSRSCDCSRKRRALHDLHQMSSFAGASCEPAACRDLRSNTGPRLCCFAPRSNPRAAKQRPRSVLSVAYSTAFDFEEVLRNTQPRMPVLAFPVCHS